MFSRTALRIPSVLPQASKASFASGNKAKSIVYSAFGSPKSVLKIEEKSVPSPSNDEVLIQMMYASINHGDINLIRGQYGTPLRAKAPPAVAGTEGAGKVIGVGQNVKSLKVGDVVVPVSPAAGTWSTHMLANEKDLVSFGNDLKPQYGAMFASPLVASLLLNEFVKLQRGDVVIQNGASGAIGQSVVQLANLMGLRTINILDANSPTVELMTERLKSLGGYVVVPDTYAKHAHMRELISDLPRPRLALNGVGGSSVTELARLLEPGGTLVTYGSTTYQPIQIPSSLFIFNQINLTGFFLPKWLETTPIEKSRQVIQQLISTYAKYPRELQILGTQYKFEDFQIAIEEFQQRGKVARVLLAF